MMEQSKFLGKVIGIYLMIVSLAMLVHKEQFDVYVAILMHDEPLVFVTGFITLIIGILLVVSHNIWEWHWRVLITLLAWLTLLKAVTLLFHPQFIDAATGFFLSHTSFTYIAGIFDYLLGSLLLYVSCHTRNS